MRVTSEDKAFSPDWEVEIGTTDDSGTIEVRIV